MRKLRTETYSVEDYPTKRLVQRELQRKLSEVNAKSYRAKPQTKFEAFSLKWQNGVLPTAMKPSSQPAIRSQLRKHLVPAFGSIALSNITPEVLQTFVSASKVSAKTTKNLIATLRIMWNTAKAWKLVEHDPFDGLKLPRRVKPTVRFFTADEMRRIIEAAQEPYKTFYWLAAETGMRGGELCALTWDDIDVDRGIVSVRRSAWRGRIGEPKSDAGRRTLAISDSLRERLRAAHKTAGSVPFVFYTRNRTPWAVDFVVKKRLHRLLDSLGIERAGLHAFRHGNATVLDQANAPTRVRQSRLGHADIETTMGYTHIISADDQKAAEELQRMIFEAKTDEKPRMTWQIAGGNA